MTGAAWEPAHNVRACRLGDLALPVGTDIAVDDSLPMRVIPEQIGGIQNGQFRQVNTCAARRSEKHVNAASADRDVHVALCSQLGRRKDLQLDFAIGRLGQLLGCEFHTLVELVRGGKDVAKFQRDILRAGRSSKSDHCRRKGGQKLQVHIFLPC